MTCMWLERGVRAGRFRHVHKYLAFILLLEMVSIIILKRLWL